MKKAKNPTRFMAVWLLILTAIFSTVLQGCGTEKTVDNTVYSSEEGENSEETSMEGENQTQIVALVLGAHKYFPYIPLETKTIYNNIYNAAYTCGRVSVVISDGEPYLAADYNISEPSSRVDKQKANQLAENNAAAIIREASQFTAKTAEVDTFSAISLAGDALQSSGADTERTLIVCDNGMCTSGLLTMLGDENILDTAADEIVSQLEELHALPDLEGVFVIWIGLGAVCGEQKSLSDSDQYLLEELWTAILTAAGAEVSFDETPLSDTEYAEGLPDCTVIPVLTDSLDLTSEEIVIGEVLENGIIWDGESKLTFLGDLAEFTDYDAAVGELEPIAEYLSENLDQSIVLFGMTASVSEDGYSGIELATARTEACKSVLLELGASDGQITCVGLGQTANRYRVDDLNPDGTQIEEMAAKNRAVIIVSSDSPLTDELMAVLE
ncbi:MAG: hypothetical protein LUE19_04175 [Clostridiales bacterium]|nr:hypothetical protein [Clostridiales bacterium]